MPPCAGGRTARMATRRPSTDTGRRPDTPGTLLARSPEERIPGTAGPAPRHAGTVWAARWPGRKGVGAHAPDNRPLCLPQGERQVQPARLGRAAPPCAHHRTGPPPDLPEAPGSPGRGARGPRGPGRSDGPPRSLHLVLLLAKAGAKLEDFVPQRPSATRAATGPAVPLGPRLPVPGTEARCRSFLQEEACGAVSHGSRAGHSAPSCSCVH